MTPEQIYHRRLARKYGAGSIEHWAAVEAVPTYRGKFSAYWYAKQAAWHAFKAHPELRPEHGFNNVCLNMLKLIPYAIENGNPWDYKGAHLHEQVRRIAQYAAELAFELHPELREAA